MMSGIQRFFYYFLLSLRAKPAIIPEFIAANRTVLTIYACPKLSPHYFTTCLDVFLNFFLIKPTVKVGFYNCFVTKCTLKLILVTAHKILNKIEPATCYEYNQL